MYQLTGVVSLLSRDHLGEFDTSLRPIVQQAVGVAMAPVHTTKMQPYSVDRAKRLYERELTLSYSILSALSILAF